LASAASPSAGASQPASLPPFPAISLPPESRAEVTEAVPFAALPGEPATGRLEPDTAVIITAGPRDVGGGTWYELRWPPDAPSGEAGWVRVNDTSVLIPVEPACPVTTAGVLGMQPWDRVRCLSETASTVEATVGHCQGGVVQVEPAWLGYACWSVSDATGSMGLHANPGSGITFPDDLVRARMTGHFDDPAATTCVYTGDNDPAGGTPSASEQVFLCREAFVVDTFEILAVIGTPAA
jgi:hypothetical protein